MSVNKRRLLVRHRRGRREVGGCRGGGLSGNEERRLGVLGVARERKRSVWLPGREGRVFWPSSFL